MMQNSMEEKKRKKKKKKKMPIPLMAALVVCAGVLLFSIWQLSGIFLEYKKGIFWTSRPFC